MCVCVCVCVCLCYKLKMEEKLIGDMWDKDYVKMGGGQCISNRVCF